jgi:hypothetical protein
MYYIHVTDEKQDLMMLYRTRIYIIMLADI